MNEDYSIDTVEAPGFEEYLNRYSEGVTLGMDSALDAAHQIEEEFDNAALFGSLVTYPDYYGVQDLKRPTDLSADFMLPEEEIADISQDYDVWEFDNCYFAEIPAEVDGEQENLAVGLVPIDEDIFGDGELPSMRLGAEVLEDAEVMSSDYGSIPVVDAETNYALKARRYVDSLLQETHIKSNDLSDQASMHLANQRRDNVLDHEKAANKIVDYTSAQFPPYETSEGPERRNSWVKGTKERVSDHVGAQDWELIMKDWESLEEEINSRVTP